MRGLLRVGDTPVIPGSTFKGCIRAIFEAITASCIGVTRAPNLPRDMQTCRRTEHLCLSCRVFGAHGFQGLIRFGDMRQTAGGVTTSAVPQLFRPRISAASYMSERYVRGRKFYMHSSQQAEGDLPVEVCPVGSRFESTVSFTNLNAAQLGVLLVALGQHPEHSFVPKLGGAKPACYGSLRVNIVSLTQVNPQQDYAIWDTVDNASLDVAPLLTAAEALLVPNQLQALANVLRWPNDRECPTGAY
jgi:hypothetical protein